MKNEEPITNDNKLDKISNSNGLVQCYADIIEALCQHSDEYTEMDSTTTANNNNYIEKIIRKKTSRKELLESLIDILTVTTTNNENDNNCNLENLSISKNNDDDDTIRAYAVPTFQAPKKYFKNLIVNNKIPYDVDVICN